MDSPSLSKILGSPIAHKKSASFSADLDINYSTTLLTVNHVTVKIFTIIRFSGSLVSLRATRVSRSDAGCKQDIMHRDLTKWQNLLCFGTADVKMPLDNHGLLV